ncbi:glycerol-3-phosphate acyltransferase [Azomonas agilis]|uniref:Glycerol-3-phosphate acyltransferase n=1 Tax=Azomonas agilis TaxID=116849 RepID=A0A562J1Z2_9GAMM|nr:1-acyl-sn-glycerol-3-phosphate acyltransferase [Azomonas agilis]TWH77147.1 glycerol-3-phosphate acyltransferase [Azomonas agilis]
MDAFEAIRPYSDAEVTPVLQRLLNDSELLNTLAHFRFPRLAPYADWALRPLIAWRLRREFAGINTVDALQKKIELYVDYTVEQATDGISYSGLEHLSAGQAYLFLSNHRDIVMDPAFVNYVLFHAKLPTPRIAIGDNLLQKPFVSDLMRLNKSFIVHRSLTGRREKLAAYQLLSAYINHSLIKDQHSIWIAQAEGRAKDGDDRTDSAILKMLHMSRKDESFAQVMQELHIVPVSISYEYDPCDQAKARELCIRAQTGSYTKVPGEDDNSIAKGITGYKGRVHIHFGTPVSHSPEEAKQLANQLDRQILSSYRLFPVHYLAYAQWDQRETDLGIPALDQLFKGSEIHQAQETWEKRLEACPEEQRPYLIQQYAMPVRNQYRLAAGRAL